MGTRINSFPFFEPDENDYRADELEESASRLVEAYGKDGGEGVAQMLRGDGVADDCYALSYGLSHDMWAAWENAGFHHRSTLGDELLKLAMVWCGIVARQAFIAGVASQQEADSLEQLLEGIDFGEDDELG